MGQLTKAICTNRLYPEANSRADPQTPEENKHRWRPHQDQTLKFPLMRIWDRFSGSRPNEHGDMLARDSDRHLDTFGVRKSTLTTHINHSEWISTPYISFTSDPEQIKDLCSMRSGARRGSQTLTVIDPSIRLRAGLPIIDVGTEMEHYNIESPYKSSGGIFVNHYACLWQVNADEIVGHWPRAELLVLNPDWYSNIIMPAFSQYNSEMKLTNIFMRLRISTNSLIAPQKEASSNEDAVRQMDCSVSRDHEDENAGVEAVVTQDNAKRVGDNTINGDGDEGEDTNASDD